MGKTKARFQIEDIKRILLAAKKADVHVRVEIEGEKITVENLPDEIHKSVELVTPIVL